MKTKRLFADAGNGFGSDVLSVTVHGLNYFHSLALIAFCNRSVRFSCPDFSVFSLVVIGLVCQYCSHMIG